MKGVAKPLDSLSSLDLSPDRRHSSAQIEKEFQNQVVKTALPIGTSGVDSHSERT